VTSCLSAQRCKPSSFTVVCSCSLSGRCQGGGRQGAGQAPEPQQAPPQQAAPQLRLYPHCAGHGSLLQCVQLPARRAEVWCRFVWRLSPETRSGEGEVHTSGLAAKWPGPCPQRYLFDELNCLICGERCEVRALSTNSCTPVQKPKAASGAITTLQFTEWIVAPASALALRVLRHLGAPTCELRS